MWLNSVWYVWSQICGQNYFVFPLTPERNQHFIVGYNIFWQSQVRVSRIKETITNKRSSRFSNKSSCQHKKMYRERNGENDYRCWGKDEIIEFTIRLIPIDTLCKCLNNSIAQVSLCRSLAGKILIVK